MTQIPETLLIASIEFDPDRTEYNGIEPLAESISEIGLIQPIILSELPSGRIVLTAGGRRLKSCLHLGYTHLYHATTSEPGRPGFLIKGLESDDILQILVVKIAENQDREATTWQDEMRLLVKAYRVASAQAAEQGLKLLTMQFGHMIGVDRTHIEVCVKIYDDVTACPKDYTKCESVRQALAVFLRKAGQQLTKILADHSIREVPLYGPAAVTSPTSLSAVRVNENSTSIFQPNVTNSSAAQSVTSDPSNPSVPTQVIDLSKAFRLGSALDIMRALPVGSVDHIITDPDYGVDPELLSENGSADSGVAQSSIQNSLADLKTFITLAYHTIREQGFLVFFYDLDHHEKIKLWCIEAGWLIQRWPLTWVKSDHRANGAPSFNFPKNTEWAFICRKPGTTLARVQTSCTFTCPRGDTVKRFGHPFAKPLDLWKWIFMACTHKGDVILDPFMGSASSTVAAIEFGLSPIGIEINPDHYNRALLNIQDAYRSTLRVPLSFI